MRMEIDYSENLLLDQRLIDVSEDLLYKVISMKK